MTFNVVVYDWETKIEAYGDPFFAWAEYKRAVKKYEGVAYVAFMVTLAATPGTNKS